MQNLLVNKRCYILFLFLISVWSASSQITGKVVDALDNSPLEYATAALYIQNENTLITGVVTNTEGYFKIDNLKEGTYYLELSFLGYQSKKITNISVKNKAFKQDVGLVALTLGTTLNEVVIQTERATLVNKIDRQVFDAATFQNSQGGSAIDVLKNLPSVSVNGLGELSVRGSTSFVLLINGKPIQGNASNFISQIPANSIQRIEVITAPSAKYDPEGKAGIINILTQKGTTDGSFLQLNVKGGFPSIETYGNENYHQRYGTDLTYNIMSSKWNISMGANYQRNDLGGQRIGDVFTIINDTLTQFPSRGERSFDEINYSGRFSVDFQPDSTNTYSLGFYAGKRSKDRLADIVYFDNHAITPVVGGNRVYEFQYFNHNLRKRKGDFVLGSLDYSHLFNDKSKISTSFLYEYTLLGGPTTNDNLGFPDNSIVYQNEYNTNDNPLHGVRFQLDYVLKPLAFGTLETGYQYRKLVNEGDFVYERKNNNTGIFELVPEFSSEVNLNRIIHSGYVQLTGNKNQWDYAAGIRLESMNRDFDLRDKSNTIDTTYVYDYVKLFPTASIQYAINDDSNLKLAYSKRVERTIAFEMNPFPEREHSETLEQGDPSMKPQFIDLFELGFTKKFKGGNSFYATSYFRNVNNVINRVNTIYNDTILNRIYTNVGKAQSLGLELGTQLNPTKKWSNFLGLNMYNYRIKGTFDGDAIDDDAFIYSINANSTLQFWDTASLQFTFNYLSRRNTAQGEDSQFYAPNLTLKKSFLDNKLTATLQWQNIDLGLLNTNEQRITTFKPNEFYTTTNYIYEVDMVTLNLSYTFNKAKNRSKFIDSEFGKREF